MIAFTAFESAAMNKILDGDSELLRALRAQYAAARVASRDISDAGFFCNFDVPKALALPGKPDFELDDVSAEVAGVSRGLSLLLFVREGLMTLLEGSTFEEPWPNQIRDFRLYYNFVPRVLPLIRTNPSDLGND